METGSRVNSAVEASAAISRADAVSQLQRELTRIAATEDHSICQAAKRRGIFCHGFDHYTDDQFRQRYAWLVRHDPTISREKLEEIADRWQLSRQEAYGLPLACDVQTIERETCRGWNEFSNEDLARFCEEILGSRVNVIA